MKWRFWKREAVKEPPAQPAPRVSLTLVAAIRECEQDNTDDATENNNKNTDDNNPSNGSSFKGLS